ncbi:MAG: hypothetical protein OXI49_03305 [Acidobacteriota bacterium]|nr:hypothetical protein [Acidobacteriota bacterium]
MSDTTTYSRTTENAEIEIDPTPDGEVQIEFPSAVLPLDTSLVLRLTPEGAKRFGEELIRVADIAAQGSGGG